MEMRYIQGEMVFLSIVENIIPQTRIVLRSRRDFDVDTVRWLFADSSD